MGKEANKFPSVFSIDKLPLKSKPLTRVEKQATKSQNHKKKLDSSDINTYQTIAIALEQPEINDDRQMVGFNKFSINHDS